MLDSALGWIGQIAEWFGKFFPRWETLDMTQGAIKSRGSFFKKGITVISCGPGLHWYWPATTRWEMYSTAFQTDNLPSQTVETKDGVSVTIGAMISYRVGDVAKLLTQCVSPVMAIRTITLPAIHMVACRLDFEVLKEAQRKQTINTSLRNAAKKSLAELGIDVDSIELTDLTKVRTLRLIQSTQNDMEG